MDKFLDQITEQNFQEWIDEDSFSCFSSVYKRGIKVELGVMAGVPVVRVTEEANKEERQKLFYFKSNNEAIHYFRILVNDPKTKMRDFDKFIPKTKFFVANDRIEFEGYSHRDPKDLVESLEKFRKLEEPQFVEFRDKTGKTLLNLRSDLIYGKIYIGDL